MHRAGAFATFVTAPVEALIPWPEGLTAAEACLAEPLANGVHVTRLLSDQRPMNVLVLGAGPIGLMCMQCLKRIVHCRVGVTDRLTTRLDAAKALGADAVFDSEDPDIARWADWDASVDAVGASPTKKASLDTIRTGGTAVWIGLHENEGPLEAYSVILAEKRIQGSYGATANDLRKGVEMMEKREVDVHTWTTSYPLSQGVEAFQRMLNPGPGDLKAVLTPENA
jgi:L-iditol 2-dehydrogenase